ncbi:Amino-acid permease inda1 [Colletotrichum tropicale]|nr:Amino-acid permease inda1 [Colletotrichum tropicale]
MATEKDIHDGVSTPETTQVRTGTPSGGLPPVTGKAATAYGDGALSHGAAQRDDNFYTRNGLNFESFKPRDYGRGIVELDRTMKSRHLHMIAIGGSIGAGFFVGSGGALSTGGPGSVLIDFMIIGVMMFNVVYALGELAVMYPVSGGFYIYSSRFIDPSWGFAMGIFMIVAFILVLGGGPSHGRYNEYWGARYWYDPGAFQNGFKGFCGVFVTAAFSFAGTELVGLAAAESANPLRSLPGAIKQVFWRITLFYILGLFFVGLLVPANDPTLLGAENAYADGASPFVIAAKHAGLHGYDHFMNCIILVSVLSLGVSCVYGGSRTLTALAQQGYAPKIFSYVDKGGRPLPSVVVHLLCGALAFMNLDADGETVFNWLLNMSALAALFTWGSICLSHIRFRKAWAYHGHTVDEIPFQAAFGVAGSWVGLGLCIIVLIAQFFVAIAPPKNNDELNDAEGFFEAMLTVPVIMVFWVIGFAWKRTGWLRTHQMDVDTGRRELDWDEINAFKAEVASWPTWKRMMHRFF